jgi:hypothetical protein
MDKIDMRIKVITGLVAAVVMIGGVSTANSAFAMGCLNRQIAQKSLTEDVRPYDQWMSDKVAQQGNHCPTNAQANPASMKGITTPAPVNVSRAKANAAKY